MALYHEIQPTWPLHSNVLFEFPILIESFFAIIITLTLVGRLCRFDYLFIRSDYVVRYRSHIDSVICIFKIFKI